VCITEHCQPVSIEHLKRQNQQDGLFHLAMLGLVAPGSYSMFYSASRSDPPHARWEFFHAVCSGWGLFNLIEGLIDHRLLGIHHVLPGAPYQVTADILFLGSGVGQSVPDGGCCTWRSTRLRLSGLSAKRRPR
jgi:uncharacterized membrane protein